MGLSLDYILILSHFRRIAQVHENSRLCGFQHLGELIPELFSTVDTIRTQRPFRHPARIGQNHIQNQEHFGRNTYFPGLQSSRYLPCVSFPPSAALTRTRPPSSGLRATIFPTTLFMVWNKDDDDLIMSVSTQPGLTSDVMIL